MNWLNGQLIEWEEPLAFASRFHGHDIALLYSGMREAFSGQTSFLCLTPIATREGETWDALPTSPLTQPNLPDWIGHLGYGMRETASHGEHSHITLPAFRFTRYAHLFRFDHVARTVEHFVRQSHALPLPEQSTPIVSEAHIIRTLTSNFTRAKYEQSIAATVEQIHAGNFYQANITRKFFGNFAAAPDSWALFTTLCHASPAPYSAYIRHGGSAILSASPECFLSIDEAGHIITRPIKGSARRSAHAAEDARIQHALQTSDKNNAENLMIVDLMRNDLARVSVPESVEVTEQSGLYSYATIHHLISTIRAQKRNDVTTPDIIKACFPPGSMTGAPKIAAMKWCAEQERLERGVYSGAIGWFGANGSCDLSVVIRTLLVDGDRFEFQVGGGIVADSTPEDEWQETLIKARGIAKALGLTEEDLAKI